MKNKNLIKLVTHNGSFHADDVFATAVLALLLEKRGEKYEVIRTRDEDKITSGDFVYDVGGIYDADKNRFDHHQTGGAGKRESAPNIEYSSVGLVWKKFGRNLSTDQQSADLVDKKLIAAIDAGDNGMELTEKKYNIWPYYIQSAFHAMRPTWKEDVTKEDEIFLACVEMAKTILSREIVHARDAIEAEVALLKIYTQTKNKKIIVLDKENYPFDDFLSRFPEPLFVICKRKINDTWGAKAVRDDSKSFKNRKNFPKSWAGLKDAGLQTITGVDDAIFCHRGLFLAVAKSKEGAIKLAEKAIEAS